jgi:hypothetical protein
MFPAHPIARPPGSFLGPVLPFLTLIRPKTAWPGPKRTVSLRVFANYLFISSRMPRGSMAFNARIADFIAVELPLKPSFGSVWSMRGLPGDPGRGAL